MYHFKNYVKWLISWIGKRQVRKFDLRDLTMFQNHTQILCDIDYYMWFVYTWFFNIEFHNFLKYTDEILCLLGQSISLHPYDNKVRSVDIMKDTMKFPKITN